MKPCSRWQSKAVVLQWDTYPEPTESLLIGWLTELIWNPRFKSSMSTQNINSQSFWTKGNFKRDDWNNLLDLFSCAFKNHSGVKTCGVAEPRARQVPQKPAAVLESTRQNLLVVLSKLTSQWESDWKEFLAGIMKIILQEKEWIIHWVTTIFCTNLFRCLKQWRYQMQRLWWEQNGRK